MTSPNGEVSVKRDGHVHAISAPELEGPISIDVDAEHVKLPPETEVSFQDPTGEANDEEIETDGGAAPTRSEVEMRGGLAMSAEQSRWSVVLVGFAFLIAGHLWDVQAGLALVVAGIGGALGWFAINSLVRWREIEQ